MYLMQINSESNLNIFHKMHNKYVLFFDMNLGGVFGMTSKEFS
jgi:hypothetical protein